MLRWPTTFLLIQGLVSGLAGAAESRAKPALTLDAVLESLGFSSESRTSLLEGETIVRDLDALGENDIGVTLALVVPHPPREVMDFLFSEEGVKLDPNVREFKELAGEKTRDDDLKGVTFVGEESSELASLIDVEEGYDVNLGSDEIEQMGAVRKEFPDASPDSDAECAVAVNRAHRRMLLERCRAYQEGGLDSVRGYARGDTNSLPGKELRLALEKDRLLAERFPDLRRAVLGYPKGEKREFESRLYWLKETIDGRPAFALGQRTFYRWSDGGIVVDRQFYVGHSYNSLHSVTGAIPLEKGTLVFYTYRMFTDEVTGFASALKRLLATNELKSDLDGQSKNLEPRLEEWLKTRPKGEPARGAETSEAPTGGPPMEKKG